MRRLSPLVVLLILALLALPVGAGADTGAGSRSEAGSEAARGIVRGDFGSATSPEAALASVADQLGIDADDFAFHFHRTSLIGEHYRGSQVVDGLAVDGTAAAVHMVNGRVTKVEAVDNDATGGAVTFPVGRAVAEAAALHALGARNALSVVTRRLLVPTDGRLVDTYRVSIVAPLVAGTVDVSAANASVLNTFDDRRFADAVATIFNPNPIATSGHTDMRQDVDIAGVDVDFSSDSRIAEEYADLPIIGFDAARGAAGNLSGPYANVIAAGPMVPVLGRFDVDKTDPRFEGLMAYHHVTAIQGFFQDVLGLDNINNESQEIITLPVMGFDNSFYQPANDLMLMGNGGVDDGEDAEVIIHELGHAIHDDQVPGWGGSAEGGAMGEGFGDFLAGAYFATFEGTVRSQDTCLMEWDATSYDSEPQTCLRRMDTAKTYDDKVNAVHADGEIWSKYMWNVRNRLGGTELEKSSNVLRLLLTAHFSMSTRADFAEAIRELSVAALADGVAPDAQTGIEWDQIVYEEAIALNMPVPVRVTAVETNS